MKAAARAAAAVTCLFLITPGAWAATVQSGFDPDAELLGGVRYRSFKNTGGQEVYLGKPDLGQSQNRVAKNIVWSNENDFTIAWDGSVLSTVIDTGDDVYNLSDTLGPLGDLNYLQFSVVGRNKKNGEYSKVFVDDLALDGHWLGDFDGTGGWSTWSLEGLDLTGGFELTGTLLLDGMFSNSQEKSKFELGFGNAPTVVPTPTAAAAGLLALGVLGISRRPQKRGG